MRCSWDAGAIDPIVLMSGVLFFLSLTTKKIVIITKITRTPAKTPIVAFATTGIPPVFWESGVGV
ncbi:hypothetical protein TVAG_229190 [Trichomonas vaginalis G3]|uniref:Uncharacterized protein n=1 Tax=Trichomonas vaginalis (strain ATCC PRA-98 / G3) TaxID=412133 RepID=A2FBQ5_TRIV3|nr:hypothetical protein TVAG_229190 [Trichomonas vaginalis G3]|eukprot:XP_001310582.1 hypothetical protein [Trichomonas vaginalis G3]